MQQQYAQTISELGATIRCDDCSIFIGPGHIERVPYGEVGDEGLLCRACRESAWRRAMRAMEMSTPARGQRPQHRVNSTFQ